MIFHLDKDLYVFKNHVVLYLIRVGLYKNLFYTKFVFTFEICCIVGFLRFTYFLIN